ncbi:carboxypeptidase-like regulatory domain-containing protein [Sphingobacterium thalpophilum]|uniref:carboxypeptidase-like regulatory domain-containing protein n=1 Tax=Sphingobacterium thalpophilum TaxID=259 RepID=UPI0024A65438|nr:carboxypeptidase-like regulatory domain-containing protein [Sphingobacterium thalpophilum]
MRFWSGIFFILFLMFSCYCASAQLLDGRVVSRTSGDPISGAIISLYSVQDSDRMLQYLTTDDKGRFRLREHGFPFILKVRCMSFQTFRTKVSKASDFPAVIMLKDESILMDEVLVNMNKGFASFNNDTTVYSLKALNLQDRDNLKEILLRIPGFKVDENYKIVHGGKEINKILINGKEVFEFQNKIALENMESGMLDHIRVIANYQDPFRVNLGNEHEEKVLDLKVKDSFTNILKGNVESFLGYKNKYKFKPFLFYFGDNLSLFSLTNINNVFDKDWSSEDYAGAIRSNNVASSYYSSQNKKVFYTKDITLNNESSLLNATMIKKNTERYSLQAVLNLNYLKSIRLSEENTRFLGNNLYVKNSTDSLRARMIGTMLNFRYKMGENSIVKNIFSNYQDRLKGEGSYESIYPQTKELFNLGEVTEQKSNILSNRLTYESKIDNALAWSMGWDWKNEISRDIWQLQYLEATKEQTNRNKQNIKFSSIENTFRTNLRQLLGKVNTLVYELSYSNIHNSFIPDDINQAKTRYIARTEANFNLKRFNLRTTIALQRQRIEVFDSISTSTFLLANINLDYFLDRFKKNRLIFNWGRTTPAPDVKSGLTQRVITYDQTILGNRQLLHDIYAINTVKFGYLYDFPFKGQSFRINFYRQHSEKALVQFIDVAFPLLRNLKLVEGYRNVGIDVSYAQNLFKDQFPVNVSLSYNYQNNRSHQFSGVEESPIKQQNHGYMLNLNSFSSGAINISMTLKNDYIRYGYQYGLLSDQNTLLVLLGPKFNNKRMEWKTMLKYSAMKSVDQRREFMDVDLSSVYIISKKLEMMLTCENLLQNLGFKNNSVLSVFNNQNGIENFQSFKNLVGYSAVGVKYRF